MNILEFIETQYPIKERVLAKLENPYKRIEEMDDLPYDKIGPDEFGNVTKLVEVEEGRYVSVMELMGYSREELVASKDETLLLVWEVYMSQIDLEDLNIVDIMECVKQHQSIESMRQEQLGVLSI